MEIDAHIEMVNKMEESYIDKIYELSNNRIAVIKIVNDFPQEEVLKIYSLNNFKLLSEIKLKEKTKNIVFAVNNLINNGADIFEYSMLFCLNNFSNHLKFHYHDF